MRSYIATLICRTRGFGAASSGVCELKVSAVATRPVDVYLIEVKAVVGAMCAPIAVAYITAAIFIKSDSTILVKNFSVVSVDRHYGVPPPPLSSSSGQSVSGMQLEPPGLGLSKSSFWQGSV
jgi:hypothetical protein